MEVWDLCILPPSHVPCNISSDVKLLYYGLMEILSWVKIFLIIILWSRSSTNDGVDKTQTNIFYPIIGFKFQLHTSSILEKKRNQLHMMYIWQFLDSQSEIVFFREYVVFTIDHLCHVLWSGFCLVLTTS